MAYYPFDQIDVFCDDPPGGNPLAVIHDATGLDDTAMAQFAAWTNLSETTYLLPPTDAGRAAGADYRVRIFTPGGELPFAGHPTIGSCHAWLARGGTPATPGRVVQECGIGLVELSLEEAENSEATDGGAATEGGAGAEGGAATDGNAAARIAFAAPPLLRSGPAAADDVRRAAMALGLTPADIVAAAWVDNGPGWLGLLLPDAAVVLGLRPDYAAMGDAKIGVIGPHPAGGPADVEVRAFCPGFGVPEDPVTGSLNAGLAVWLIGAGRLPDRYVAAQGAALGRRGRVHIRRDADGTIWVGGAARTVLTGTAQLGRRLAGGAERPAASG